jgi:hypothetical protein
MNSSIGNTPVFVNLTEQDLYIEHSDGGIRHLKPSGKIAQCAMDFIYVGEIDKVRIFRMEFGEVQNLPEPEEGIIFIVSNLVRTACPERKDVFAVVVGCEGLTSN